jgi:hypothetical protein
LGEKEENRVTEGKENSVTGGEKEENSLTQVFFGPKSK